MASGRLLSQKVETFNECYKIIKSFLGKGYYYYLCNLSQGCPIERDCLAGVRHYCCVCRVFIHYSIQELDMVKKNILKLKKLYFDILDDLQEIKKVQLAFDFWDDEVESKFRDWYTRKEVVPGLFVTLVFLFWFSLHFLCFS